MKKAIIIAITMVLALGLTAFANTGFSWYSTTSEPVFEARAGPLPAPVFDLFELNPTDASDDFGCGASSRQNFNGAALIDQFDLTTSLLCLDELMSNVCSADIMEQVVFFPIFYVVYGYDDYVPYMGFVSAQALVVFEASTTYTYIQLATVALFDYYYGFNESAVIHETKDSAELNRELVLLGRNPRSTIISKLLRQHDKRSWVGTYRDGVHLLFR